MLTEKERRVYHKWRIRILLSVIIGYATYYLCRQNFSMIMPLVMDEFNYSKTDMGYVLTCASVVYGIGKFVNGYISDKSNARYFISIGLFLSAVITLFLGFVSNLYLLGFLWCVNHWFQSMGWPPIARMLTHWFARQEMGTKWAYGSSSHQVGGAATIVFTGYIVTEYGWRFGFFIPSIIAISIAFFLFVALRESPKSVGLINVERYKAEAEIQKQRIAGKEVDESIINNISNVAHEEEHWSAMKIFRKVFLNINIWYIGFANMCLYIVRVGIICWGPLFIKETQNISLKLAGYQVAAYELTGLFGGLVAGYLSDKIFNGKRGVVGGLYMLFLALTIYIFWNINSHSLFVNTLLFILIGFFVYGPQVLVGVASADFASKKAVGTANGFAGSMAYVGSALSGIVVGRLSDLYGWNSVLYFFFAAALMGALFFFLTWLRTDRYYNKNFE